jgi:hypothetical protein
MDAVKTVDAAPEVPFEISCGQHFIPRSSKFRMIQPLKIQDELDFAKIWPEAQIVCGDVTGALIEKFRADGVHLPGQRYYKEEAVFGTIPEDKSLVIPILHVRNQEAPTASVIPPPRPIPAKVDLRTKAGRAMKEQKV